MKASGRFSKSRGLRASVPFFLLPHPLPSTFLLSPHFSCGPNVKVRLLRTGTLATRANSIHSIGLLKQNLAKNISLQRFNCNILGLTDTVALLANEARFSRFRVFFGACSFQNEVVDPPFCFYLFGNGKSLPFCVANLKKICAWELLGANVLKVCVQFVIN